MPMILLEPANTITHLNRGDQAADHLINGVFEKKRPLIFFEGPICLGSLWLGEFFASAILSRYLGKLWVVGKPLGLGFTSQRFLSIFFD
jgi:hypothetical protein